jgi:hypothetical protein
MQQATPLVDQLHRYWLALSRRLAAEHAQGPASSGKPPVPPRHFFDPADIIELLPNLMLVEFEDQPFRVRYRLTGTQVDENSGVNLTGSYLDQFDDGVNAAAFGPVIDAYRRAREQGAPEIGHYRWTRESGHETFICFGIFPLEIDGQIRQAIGIEEYDPSIHADPLRPLQHH